LVARAILAIMKATTINRMLGSKTMAVIEEIIGVGIEASEVAIKGEALIMTTLVLREMAEEDEVREDQTTSTQIIKTTTSPLETNSEIVVSHHRLAEGAVGASAVGRDQTLTAITREGVEEAR